MLRTIFQNLSSVKWQVDLTLETNTMNPRVFKVTDFNNVDNAQIHYIFPS